MELKDKWWQVVEAKNTVLCAGFDPADFRMGRGSKGLPKGTDLKDWTMAYLEAVEPFVAAIKPNSQYFKADHGIESGVYANDWEIMTLVMETAREMGLVVIEDSKLADIGSTNDAGFYAAAQKADAVTMAPYAGNMEEGAEMAHARDIGVITMCLMSNPEYAGVKNSLHPVSDHDIGTYDPEHLVGVDGEAYVRQYAKLAHDAQGYGVDGIVIGAPSEKNHITDPELAVVRSYVYDDMLVLLPGVGAQGGEAGKIWEHFDPMNVIVNVGRSLMLPGGSNSTKEAQAWTAKMYKSTLNQLRGA